MAIGWAYSSPPLRLKRFPVAASASISIVRALVVNLGVYLHFAHAFGDGTQIARAVWALTVFVLPFSFAIAVLKDVPDAEGDRAYRVRTFTVRFGQRRALGSDGGAHAGLPRHGGARPAAARRRRSRSCSPPPTWRRSPCCGRGRCAWTRPTATRSPRFYMSVWALFFCEYLIVPAAVLLG